MDGITEIVEQACDVSFEIEGKTYHLSMLTLEDWAAATDVLLKMKPDPLRTALAMVANLETREEKEFILGKAWTDCRRAQVVPDFEVEAWTKTLQGMAFLLWRSLLNKHPETTIAQVQQWVRPFDATGRFLNVASVQRMIDEVHGLIPGGPTSGA